MKITVIGDQTLKEVFQLDTPLQIDYCDGETIPSHISRIRKKELSVKSDILIVVVGTHQVYTTTHVLFRALNRAIELAAQDMSRAGAPVSVVA